MDPLNEKSGFCTSCGAPLTGGAFCGSCGAKVTAAPVAAAPAAEPILVVDPRTQTAPAAWKFPLASVILVGVAAIWLIITMCTSVYWPNFLNVACIAAVLVGMIICRKERNLFVGFGFLCMALVSCASAIISFSSYIRAGADIFTTVMMQIFNVTGILCYVACAVAYLVAKPKLAILKLVACAFTAGFNLFGVLCVFVMALMPNTSMAVWLTVLRFLLDTVPLCLGTILYTPFKRR